MVSRSMRDERQSAIVGVVSDTHGLLRPEVEERLGGVDLIVHAGDVGNPVILEHLRRIAPLRTVRGNTDRGPWARDLPRSDLFEYEGRGFYVIHDILEMDLDPRAAQVAVVISGHSHRPLIESREGILYLNPGSAGPRRFLLPVAMARLAINPDGLDPEIILLQG